jgi:hypothetical protein
MQDITRWCNSLPSKHHVKNAAQIIIALQNAEFLCCKIKGVQNNLHDQGDMFTV